MSAATGGAVAEKEAFKIESTVDMRDYRDNFMDLEFMDGDKQMMGKALDLKDMPPFPEIFTVGGDEILPLDPVKGHNKYFIKPYVDENSIVRSSCTCSTPTELGYNAAKYYYDMLLDGQTTVG